MFYLKHVKQLPHIYCLKKLNGRGWKHVLVSRNVQAWVGWGWGWAGGGFGLHQDKLLPFILEEQHGPQGCVITFKMVLGSIFLTMQINFTLTFFPGALAAL